MMRQLICRGLILAAVVAGSTGCETLHSMVRSNDKDEVSSKDDNDDAKPNVADSDDNDKQSVFKPTRTRSAWSSFSPEAQSIEKDLGVY
jgi:hypothetical protein